MSHATIQELPPHVRAHVEAALADPRVQELPKDGVPKIEEQLHSLIKDAPTIRVHEANPNEGALYHIAKSLTRYGQQKPIVLAPDGQVLAGNHTFLAAHFLLGWPQVAAVESTMSEEKLVGYLLDDNRTSELGSINKSRLLVLLRQQAEDEQLIHTSYDIDDMDDLEAQVDGVPETVPEEFTGGFSEDPEETAARYAKQQQGQKHREFKLLYTEDKAKQFVRDFTDLKRAWGVSALRDVILEAVRLAAEGTRREGEHVEPATEEEVKEALAAETPPVEPGEPAGEPATGEPAGETPERGTEEGVTREEGE